MVCFFAKSPKCDPLFPNARYPIIQPSAGLQVSVAWQGTCRLRLDASPFVPMCARGKYFPERATFAGLQCAILAHGSASNSLVPLNAVVSPTRGYLLV